MHGVRLVLGVVHFDKERWGLDTVVVWTAGLRASRPGKEDVLTRLIELLHAMFGQFAGNVVGVLLDERHQSLELVTVHLGGGDSRWLAFERGLAAGGGQNVRVSGRVNDRNLLLLLVKVVHEFKPEIVFCCENAKSLARTHPHLGGVRTEEAWTTNHSPRHHRVVLAEVMPF